MRADNNIDLTGRQLFKHLFLLRRRTKSRKHSDFGGVFHHSLFKRVIVLVGKYGCRNEIRDLITAHYRLKCGTQSNLGLSVPDISAQQPVHRVRLFHISLNLIDAAQLVVRFVIRKRRLKIVLPLGVGRKRDTGHIGTLGIKLNQLFRHIRRRSLDTLFRLCPIRSAEGVKSDPCPVRFVIPIDHIELVGRDIKTSAVFIYNL